MITNIFNNLFVHPFIAQHLTDYPHCSVLVGLRNRVENDLISSIKLLTEHENYQNFYLCGAYLIKMHL